MFRLFRLLFRRVGMVAITSFTWQHRGSALRTFDLMLRAPQLLRAGRARDALTEAKAIVALDAKVPARTDVRLAGVHDGTLMVRGDVALDSFDEARATLLAVDDVVDVRSASVRQPTFDEALVSR
jgi:hypothetical protein